MMPTKNYGSPKQIQALRIETNLGVHFTGDAQYRVRVMPRQNIAPVEAAHLYESLFF
jgi:hypothetical protein